MSGLRYDPGYLKALMALTPPAPQAPAKNALEIRERANALLTMAFGKAPKLENIQEHVFSVESHDGAQIKVTRFASTESLASKEPTQAIVFLHGGGMVAGSVEVFSPMIAAYAHNSGLPFFAVHYRLAPEHPAPNGVEDAFASIKFVAENAKMLNIDATKICIMGQSAGGGIAAGTTLLARDRELSPPLAKQILVYPMLDDRTELAPEDPMTKLVQWSNSQNVIGWNAYVGEDKRGRADADVSQYAAPARAKSLRGLPSTYIEVGTLDLFRDEDMEYASRLVKDQVEVEFHLWPGLPHGFDGVRGTIWQERAAASRLDAMLRVGI